MKKLILLITLIASLTTVSDAQNLPLTSAQILTQRMKNASNTTNPYKNDTITAAGTLTLVAAELRAGHIGITYNATVVADTFTGVVKVEVLTAGGIWAKHPTADTVVVTAQTTGAVVSKSWAFDGDFSSYRVVTTTTKGGDVSIVSWETWKCQYKP